MSLQHASNLPQQKNFGAAPTRICPSSRAFVRHLRASDDRDVACDGEVRSHAVSETSNSLIFLMCTMHISLSPLASGCQLKTPPCDKLDTNSPRKVLKSSPWARHF